MKIKTAAQRNRELTRRPRAPRPVVACRICLEPEVVEKIRGIGKAPDEFRSSLAGGICRDREACELRAPVLSMRDLTWRQRLGLLGLLLLAVAFGLGAGWVG